MCGIIGTLPVNRVVIERGLRELYERGPDDQATALTDFAGVGISRLAITDLDGGAQPLSSRSGSTIVVFNGAIYNHQRLRQKFPGAFRSQNDGEVIHALYESEGLSFARHLEGMFAIIILDLKRRRMVMACDSLGIKPLYWVRSEETWVVASSIKAIPSELAGMVKRFPPGEVWATDGERSAFEPLIEPRATLIEEIRAAVQSHLPREVSWGCMLSGGIDSALVTALAAEGAAKPVLAYTVGHSASPDVVYAGKLAEEFGLRHRIVEVEPDGLMAAVERVVECTATFDPGIIVNGVGTYLVAQAARRDGLKVLLSGEGADELFGGYEEHLSIPPAGLTRSLIEWQKDLGASECLRLDRCTMACGIEARVPYLAPGVVGFARSLPPEQKILHLPDRVVGKYSLREAAQSVLPSWMVNREKIPFYKGSEIGAALKSLAASRFRLEELDEMRQTHPEFPFVNLLAVWFFHLWRSKYPRLAESWQEMVERGLARRF